MGVGVVEKPLPGGTSITTLDRRTRGGGTIVAPELRLWLTKAGTNQFYVTDGQVDGENVRFGSAGGAELDNDSPEYIFTSSARVWLALVYDLTFDQGWFVSGTLTAAYVNHGSTVPSDDLLGGQIYQELGRVVGGNITRNLIGYNLYSMLRDNSSLSSQGVVYALGRVN